MEWLAGHFTVEENPGASRSFHHYYLYGLERVGVLAGTEFIGEHEWYPLGARHLVRTQGATGSWGADPFVDTCYSVLFLRRATLPLETEAPALLSAVRDEAAMREDMPAVELILDCSGSMKEPVEGRQKMAVAREVITEVLAALPAEMQVGLRLYGHKQPPQKTDTDLVVPIGPLDPARRKTIQGWIDRARPIGWTPMVHSLLQAKGDFPTTGKGPRTVVLVSDGEETGGGKVSDVEAAYAGSGIDVVIHVVGFDVQGIPLAEQQMREIARVGKGRYYAARGTRELAAALREALPSPGVEVLDASGKVVARAAFNGDPVELKPGSYRVRLAGTATEPLEVTLPEGEEVSVRADESGRLSSVPP
jgi:Mg-chelatase subunit ChlD